MKKIKKIPKWLDWPWWVMTILLFLMFFLVALGRLDPDFGWHLKSGEVFWNDGIPATDIFTYTFSSFPWANHEWLSDILLYLLHSLGGYNLLAVVYALIWTFAFSLVGRGKLGPLVLIAAVATLPYMGVRAVTWDILFLSLTLFTFSLHNQRWRWLMIPLICLWANMHGGFLLGLFYIVYVAWRERSWRPLPIFALASLATLINPYGIHLYNEVLLILLDAKKSSEIGEWRPFGFGLHNLPLIALWLGITIYTNGKHLTRYLRFDTLLLIASLKSNRHWPLFALASIKQMDSGLRKIILNMPAKPDRRAKGVLIFVAGLLVVPILYTLIYDSVGSPDKREDDYPVAAVEYLHENPCGGNLFNEYNHGGYLIWQLPEQKVYIDGRGPIWVLNGERLFDNWQKVVEDKDYRKQEFDRYDIQCALLYEHQTDMIGELEDDGWITTVESNNIKLLEKT